MAGDIPSNNVVPSSVGIHPVDKVVGKLTEWSRAGFDGLANLLSGKVKCFGDSVALSGSSSIEHPGCTKVNSDKSNSVFTNENGVKIARIDWSCPSDNNSEVIISDYQNLSTGEKIKSDIPKDYNWADKDKKGS